MTLAWSNDPYRCLAPTVPCCDICSPSLLDRVRPGKPNTDRAIRLALEKEENPTLYEFIERWREDIYQREYKDSYLQVVNVLPDEAISRLARLKLPPSAAAIRSALVDAWPHWDLHGEELLEHLLSLPTSQLNSPVEGEGGHPPQLSMPGHSEDTTPSHIPTAIPCPQLNPAPPSMPTQPRIVPPSTPARPQHTMSTHTLVQHSTLAMLQAQRCPALPSTPVHLRGTPSSSMPASAPVPVHHESPYSTFHPPTSFSPVVMYRHPMPQYYPSTTPFGGSFSYQDLANMANSSFGVQRWHHPTFGRQGTTWPVLTSSSHPTQGSRPS
jgi:hypothetical protein